jgi:uncharacterized HAD superfamily protein/hypoxanthine phosphoribosyltransferase
MDQSGCFREKAMEYRSIANLADTIRAHLHEIPSDVDLIVGIPRSGMLAASIIALNLNRNLCDLDSLIQDRHVCHGDTRSVAGPFIRRPRDAKHILVVDDSCYSGGSIKRAKKSLESTQASARITYCAIFVTTQAEKMVDLSFETIDGVRCFEWNVMHRPFTRDCCFDIDGVLCLDPSDEENDDGDKYRHFLLNSTPLVRPTLDVGHLVTSRLERYRSETEEWLRIHKIEYGELHMLDLPDAETRRRLACHAEFKARVYKKLRGTQLFIESDPTQAIEIAKRSGKPVLSFSSQELFAPEPPWFDPKVIVDERLPSGVGRLLRYLKKLMRFS